MASQADKQDTQDIEEAKQALRVANDLCSEVLRGGPRQRRLALDFARALDQAMRAGLILTKEG